MKTVDIIIAVAIHLVIPLIGLLMYLRLLRRMKTEEIPNPPAIDLFLIFATYGGLLLVALTTLLWAWSGMASLGMFYLILVAPIIMGVIAYRNYKKKELSTYHLWTYKAGLLYYAITPVTLGLLIILE
ncbi:hypothetical protein [Algoriphagus winogradskyi]|uniref:DUF3397 domain-containing protein n=1 Tax=Algoriphagus winogradskyi TaxID=237017 RepID=A0ABY1PME5_9BACT|nr:hypothetical protein [Algoriphagus winogradskyi]SMP36719.1 hypothetical protein SAMN06265367_1191 [Algoriphagus winogradskyi]